MRDSSGLFGILSLERYFANACQCSLDCQGLAKPNGLGIAKPPWRSSARAFRTCNRLPKEQDRPLATPQVRGPACITRAARNGVARLQSTESAEYKQVSIEVLTVPSGTRVNCYKRHLKDCRQNNCLLDGFARGSGSPYHHNPPACNIVPETFQVCASPGCISLGCPKMAFCSR